MDDEKQKLLDEVERKRDFARTQGDILHHTAELREIAEARATRAEAEVERLRAEHAVLWERAVRDSARATRAEAHAERLASVIVRGLAMEQLPPYARDMEGRRTTLRKEARQALSAYRGSEV